jgi:phage portal protein BeeE
VANLIRTLLKGEPESQRLTVDEWADYFSFDNIPYGYGVNPQTTYGQNTEVVPRNYSEYVTHAYKANGVVFACMLVRQLLFSEARFQFRQLRSGRPGDLFGTQDLRILEEPWANGTTGDLLTRMIQDADLAGNFYAVRRPGNQLRRLRPDWVSIVLASPNVDASVDDIDTEVLGYLYHPGGVTSKQDPVALQRETVVHFAPIPDPAAKYMGMSWLTPVINEIIGDKAAMTHKVKFFENAATPNLLVKMSAEVDQSLFDSWIARFRTHHEGFDNAYRTLFLGGGADATVIGADMKQMDFKAVMGHSETRIAAAAGVPPVIVGLSEGLEAATYSNYASARRRFADGTMRPLWRNAAGSLAKIITVPSGSELWFDDRDIPFLQEDLKDAADVQQVQAAAIKGLVEAGFDPQSVVDAIVAGDLHRLNHAGLFSVQLQPPGTNLNGNGSSGTAPAPAANGQNGRRLLQEFTYRGG